LELRLKHDCITNNLLHFSCLYIGYSNSFRYHNKDLQVEFIAAVQIVVYVGGIVVLIIFSIFLTQQSGKEMLRPTMLRGIASLLAVLFGFAMTYFIIYKNDFKAGDKSFDWSVNKIGTQMLATGENGYALPFEVVSILLLAAMVGCIVIAIKVPAPSRPSPMGKAVNAQGADDLKIQNENETIYNVEK